MTSSGLALLSVSDKTGLTELASALAEAGMGLLATGGTWRALRQANLPVTEVSEHTGWPEMMDGRVKTLHPKIHGGILGRRQQDGAVMAAAGVSPIDLVVVNLYPFTETVACGAPEADVIEQIDIGGPALIRSAAKNHADVLVAVDPADYPELIRAWRSGAVDADMRRRFARKAFQHTAEYDAAIARWFDRAQLLPERLLVTAERTQVLRYGENPHQAAAFYVQGAAEPGTVAGARQLCGKPLSFNNLVDADAAWACVQGFPEPACVLVKHANPCGVALGADLTKAYQRAFTADPTSAFGAVIAFNRPLDAGALTTVLDNQFVEVILAPAIAPDAEAAASAKANVRILACGQPAPPGADLEIKSAAGGILAQTVDASERAATATDNAVVGQWRQVTRRAPDAGERRDLEFAWQVVRFVKSNAIVHALDACTLGVGAGQMSRVQSVRIAGLQAAGSAPGSAGCVMASDAFFPFRDGIDAAAEAGVRAVIQPGGSRRDEEVIAAANEHDMAMLFTGKRLFRH